jgi:Right handed beta helix region
MRHPSRVRSLIVLIMIPAMAPLAASAQGAIEGTVTFWGDPDGGTQIEIAAHSSPYGPPDENTFVSVPSGSFSIPIADGTYYVAALMARDGVFGEPRPEDVLAWYDADADGDWDTVTVSDGAVTGINIDLGFVYVDIDATGGAGTGSSWADAFTDLQDGIDLAVSGVEVWAAEGTYVPGTSRSDSFFPKPGVRVCGGFTGVETMRIERDWNAHPTILSCEIGAAAATDNCYHVVLAETSNPTALFDGLTITRGYSNGGAGDDQGGGIRARGGGVTLANTTVIDNYAASTGGGVMVNLGGTVKAFNSSFINNQAVGGHGGGFYGSVATAQPQTLVNCVFTGNYAWRGGGISLESTGTIPELVNLSLSGNSAGGEGGGIFTYSTQSFTIHNSIFWGNTGTNPQVSYWTTAPTITYSIVQGGWAHSGSNILDTNPSFADAELRLNLDSPAIDAADGSFIPRDDHDVDSDNYIDGPVSVDRDFNRRWVNIPYIPDTGPVDPGDDAMDMGAYEAFDPTIIFFEGFEGGGTGNWSNVVGEL